MLKGRLRNSLLFQILIIVGLGFLIYAKSFSNAFIGDDQAQVLANSFLKSLSNIPIFFSGSSFSSGGGVNLTGVYYKPLMTTVYALIYHFFGLNPFYYHFIQLIIHLINVVVLFLVLRYFFPNWTAYFLSLVFLVHPMNVEAVAYTSALQDVLFFFFGILAFWVVSSKIPDIVSISLSSLLIFCSLLSKESGGLFIIIILVFQCLYKRKGLIIQSACNLIVFGFYLILRNNALAGFQPAFNAPIQTLSFIERLINIPKIVFYYIHTYFFPKDLAMSQHWVVREVNIANFLFPLCALIIISAILIWFLISLKRQEKQLKIAIFFLLWAIFGLGYTFK